MFQYGETANELRTLQVVGGSGRSPGVGLTLLVLLLSKGELGLHPKPSRSYGTSDPAGTSEGSPDRGNKHALEWGEFRHRLTEGVLCILDPGNEQAPAVLVGMAECPQ